jgi:Vitamin K-dependent gamma-carboxylase
VIAKVASWWFEPMPRARIAWLRTFLYAFVFVDVFVTTAWVKVHADVPGELYDPLFFGRLLPLPTPGEITVPLVMIPLLVAAAIGASGKLPRVAGIAVALLYAQWMFFAMSYGKVDHDRVGFLVALAVLPTVGAAHWRDDRSDEASGWAIRAIQVAVVCTYFLAAFAKFRFGGFDWATGSTLMRSVIRRGTTFGDPLVHVPLLLTATQWFIIALELMSPLLLVRNRAGRALLVICLVFHAVTYATIGIVFLPHVMCLLSFLPLERLGATQPQPLRERQLGL